MWLKPQNLLKCTHGKSLFSCVSFTQFPYLQQTATVIGLLFILLETFTRHTGQLFVCLLSELGLKCLYLRPLWGYELRYVLITPVSHHHPLLSVFNLIRFYSFSPWMFFFFLISEGTWVLYISFSFSNLNLNPEDMQVKSTKSTFSFFDIFCLWNHNVSCVFLWPGLYSKLRMKPLTKKVQAVPYDWCYHYTISLSIPSVLWGLFIHTMDSYWSPTLYHAWGYC